MPILLSSFIPPGTRFRTCINLYNLFQLRLQSGLWLVLFCGNAYVPDCLCRRRRPGRWHVLSLPTRRPRIFCRRAGHVTGLVLATWAVSCAAAVERNNDLRARGTGVAPAVTCMNVPHPWRVGPTGAWPHTSKGCYCRGFDSDVAVHATAPAASPRRSVCWSNRFAWRPFLVPSLIPGRFGVVSCIVFGADGCVRCQVLEAVGTWDLGDWTRYRIVWFYMRPSIIRYIGWM